MSTEPSPTRVRFHERQLLHADDLRDEQAYHLRMRRTHNLALHTWGIVAGLEPRVEVPGQETNLIVAQGMALDGYGRELVLAYTRSKPLGKLDVTAAYEVWLEYARSEPARSARTAPACDRDAAQPDRWADEPAIQLRKRTERRSTSPSMPDEVPAGDLDFSPDRPPPDDPEDRWPVFLGRIDYRDGKWEVDLSERLYAGLVAERIVSRRDAAEGWRTVVVTGGEPARPDDRFVIRTEVPGGPKEGHTWLAVRGDEKGSEIELGASRVQVNGDLVLQGGAAVEFQPTFPAQSNGTESSGGESWRMYHHFGVNGKDFTDEMRITIPSSSAKTNSVAIGSFSDGKFVPILTVKDDKSVEINGTLTVLGKITPEPIDVPPNTTPAAVFPTLPRDELLKQLEAEWENPPSLAAQLLKLLGETPKWGDLAVEIAKQSDEKYSKPIATELWKSVITTGRGAMGAAASEVKGKDEFDQFLNALPAPAGTKDFAEFFSGWAFADPVRASAVAEGLPESETDASLVAFVNALGGKQVDALIGALSKQNGVPQKMSDLLLKVPPPAATVATLGQDAVANSLFAAFTAATTTDPAPVPTLPPGTWKLAFTRLVTNDRATLKQLKGALIMLGGEIPPTAQSEMPQAGE
jgi:hypothetical protein